MLPRRCQNPPCKNMLVNGVKNTGTAYCGVNSSTCTSSYGISPNLYMKIWNAFRLIGMVYKYTRTLMTIRLTVTYGLLTVGFSSLIGKNICDFYSIIFSYFFLFTKKCEYTVRSLPTRSDAVISSSCRPFFNAFHGAVFRIFVSGSYSGISHSPSSVIEMLPSS